MQKNCSKCGIAFNCCNEVPGCWCENVQLDQKALDTLKNDFENCLCPSCLKEYERTLAETVTNEGL